MFDRICSNRTMKKIAILLIFITPIDGTIFDFSIDTLRVQNVFSDTIINFQYRLEGEALFINDSLFASVKYLSTDSMKLQFGKWMITVFYPLQFNPTAGSLNEEILMNNSWVLTTMLGDERIDFLKEPWHMSKHDISKVCVRRRFGYRKGDGVEKWSLSVFKNSQLLTITHGQFDPVVYKVDSYDESKVKMSRINMWMNNESIVLDKKENMPEPDLENVKKLLTAKEWQSKELIDYQKPGSKEDSLWIEINSSGTYFVDTTLITEKEFLNNRISFKFRNDHSHEIYASNRIIVEGTWHLKSDGKTLILNSGEIPENYFDIISISKDELVIYSSDQFALEKGGRDYMKYYYTMRLK